MDAEVSIPTLSYFFHHVFLPPKLPGGDDRSAEKDDQLLSFVEDSLRRCSSIMEEQHQEVFRELRAMITSMRLVRNEHGRLNENRLLKALQELCATGNTSPSLSHFVSEMLTDTSGSPVAFPLEITEQNAGIIIRKADDRVIFEPFELSPDNASVFATRGRLVRHFPSTAVAIAISTTQESGFYEAIANTLAKMSHQAVPGMRPQVRKAQKSHDEERDTMKPSVVTDFLSNVLLSLGTQVANTSLCKNTREEVMWDSSKLPWRRTPVWLLVRVALQLTARRKTSGSDGLYKQFMAFLLSRILDSACTASMASEVLHTMSAKISRRLLKLDQTRCKFLIQAIDSSMLAASRLMETRWNTIRQQANPPLDLTLLTRLDTERDIYFHLPELDNFLEAIPLRTSYQASSTFTPVSQIPRRNASHLPAEVLGMGSDEYRPFRLAAFESWVDKHLPSWLESNLHIPTTCDNLKDLIQRYHADAEVYYHNLPEGTSRMLLTILELWVAADRSAMAILPLLRDYKHEIPIEIYQALLLPLLHDMERLYRAEAYLNERTAFADQTKSPSIFRSYGEGSFSTRYFSRSAKHQNLLLDIEECARREKSAKVAELERSKAHYQDLMRLHSQSICESRVVYDDWGVSSTYHPSSCAHCSYEKRAANLTIEVYEWPLPESRSQKEAVVVELDPPLPLQSWRDLTVYLLDNVLKSTPQLRRTPRTEYALRDYGGLHRWQKVPDYSRLHLLSEDKPHSGMHRKEVHISSSPETTNVCLINGLSLSYFDSKQGIFMSKFECSNTISSNCLIRLPRCSVNLEKFMIRTHDRPNGETPNEVLASQDEYPTHMKLGECKALVSMSYGYELLWMSILRELSSPQIDFNKPETAIFLAQISLQTGPAIPGQPCRASHLALTDDVMVFQLLGALRNCLKRIEENLESTTSLWTFISLAARCLTVAKSSTAELLAFMAHARTTAHQWLRKLVDKLNSLQNDEQRKQSQRMLLSTALICSQTFNVDDDYLENIFKQPDAVAIFVWTSMNIYDHAQLKDENDSLQLLWFERWRRIMRRTSLLLRNQDLLCSNNGLNMAISRYWPEFTSVSDWRSSPSAEYWIESPSKSAHYNTFTGEFLVNGHPLSHLPATYTANKLYDRLFGQFLMNVMPSSRPGMDFSGTKTFEGHNVYFGMQTTSVGTDQLLIHLSKAGLNYDIVPSSTLDRILPDAFVNGFIHWYDHTVGQVEFRPIGSPWQTSDKHWRLTHSEYGWKLTRSQSNHVINPSSNIAKRIFNVLSGLDHPLHQHIIYDATRRWLEIQLPRLRLDFSARQDSSAIESRQFRGMQVDQQQSIGTLVGLRSKLVLRASQDPDNRLVLVPEGHVKLQGDFDRLSDNMHPQVSVEIGTASKVQPYWVDARLGRLTDSGTLQSKLFLAHLHATTAYCLPDPLTSITGTEQALVILKSAAVASTVHLNDEESVRLGQIAALAPIRQFYPRNQKLMQTVTWSSQLSFFSQHSLFYTLSKDLLEGVQLTSFLYPHEPQQTMKIDHSDLMLVVRDLNNAAYLRTHGYGAENFSTEEDMLYKARDLPIDSQRAARIGQMATRVLEENQSLQERPTHNLATTIYEFFARSPQIPAKKKEPQLHEVQYSADWLTKPEFCYPKLWYRIHYAFQCNQRWMNRFQIAVWLASQAYTSDASQSYTSETHTQIIQVVFGLACLSRVSEVQLPAVGNYNLVKGFRFRDYEVREIIAKAAYPLQKCPEYDIQRRQGEHSEDFRERRNRTYQNNRDKTISAMMKTLNNQWPCPDPLPLPSNDYIKVDEAMAAVSSVWNTWHENLLFLRYLERIVQALETYYSRPIHFQPVRRSVLATPSSRHFRTISVDELFRYREPTQLAIPAIHSTVIAEPLSRETCISGKLNDVVSHLQQQASSEFEIRYVLELQQSLSELQTQSPRYRAGQSRKVLVDMMQSHQSECKSRVCELFETMVKDTDMTEQGLFSHTLGTGLAVIPGQAEHLPRRSPLFFLGQLQKSRWIRLSEPWKRRIVAYGLALASLQRADRLIQCSGNESQFINELRNLGHQDWDAFEYPEWLLMECESGFLIRPVQHQIALQMMEPPDGRNATMQLNMGEGKSSVIAPSIVLALGNGSRLLRLIVTKPQFRQMRQILLSRLGNLIGRKVYQFPVSRDIRFDPSKVKIICNMLQECKEEGGVMLVQPEQLLSFQLMGIEQMISGEVTLAHSLLDTQQYLDAHSRDIIDESDEVLSVKFELVYTIGQQRPIEHSPQRWTVTQQVLQLVRQLAPSIQSEFSESMEVHYWRGESWRYPRIRIFKEDAMRKLVECLVERICKEGLDGFPISRQPELTRLAVQKYMSISETSLLDIATVEKGTFWTDSVVGTLLLLRGLISGGVISHALSQKRWRVNYGVDANRVPKTKLAVPFRAKDDPAPRSEFSHPDVVLVLTSLSYYYSGLEDQDLFDTFRMLKNNDQATSEYASWIQDASPDLPHAYRDLAGINLRDRVQCTTKIFPHLRYSKGAIDYFMSHAIFSKEMKEFPHKLSASGWDLCKARAHPVTGFSGTNDSRCILPASIQQLDLPQQRHTNALVLEYLVQPETGVFLMSQCGNYDGPSSDGAQVLSRFSLLVPQVRVILDVGAQIIDLTNLQAAQCWLQMVQEDGDQTQAVIFFDEYDVLSVIDRSGCIEPFQISPFAKQTDKCLVFLDESHTRGTDLKLPIDYRAAVTLGQNLTKDRLVQGMLKHAVSFLDEYRYLQ